MINLLPYEHKKEIRAGRTNILLVRYITMMVMSLVVLGGLVGGSYVVLNNTKTSAEQKVQDNEKNVAAFKDVKNRTESFRSDLATAKAIFDKEVTYSKLIYKIADVIPQNVVLDNLTLDPQKLGSSATMAAKAKTYEDAVKLKEVLIKNDELFTDVSFETVTCSSSTDEYPVTISMKVTIKREAIK
mgnify:FL=1